MNKVILMGRLSQDIEMKYNGEFGIARTSMAVQRDFKDKKTNEYGVDFLNIVAFGKTAEFMEKYFHKGMKALIEGKIQTGSYTDKNGQKRYTFDVVADKVEFVESKGNSQQNERPAQYNTQPQEDPANDGFMNIPDEIDEELPFN